MRTTLALSAAAVLSLLVARGVSQTSSAKLVPAPMRAEQVKPGLFVIRGPFDPCAPGGCRH